MYTHAKCLYGESNRTEPIIPALLSIAYLLVQILVVAAALLAAHVLTTQRANDGRVLRGRRSVALSFDDRFGAGSTVGLMAVGSSLAVFVAWLAFLVPTLGVPTVPLLVQWPMQALAVCLLGVPAAIALNLMAGALGGRGRTFGIIGGLLVALTLPLTFARFSGPDFDYLRARDVAVAIPSMLSGTGFGLVPGLAIVLFVATVATCSARRSGTVGAIASAARRWGAQRSALGAALLLVAIHLLASLMVFIAFIVGLRAPGALVIALASAYVYLLPLALLAAVVASRRPPRGRLVLGASGALAVVSFFV